VGNLATKELAEIVSNISYVFGFAPKVEVGPSIPVGHILPQDSVSLDQYLHSLVIVSLTRLFIQCHLTHSRHITASSVSRLVNK
jgi:hypothetical protein